MGKYDFSTPRNEHTEETFVEEFDPPKTVEKKAELSVFQLFLNIYLPILILVGVVVFLAFAVAITRRRVFQQHTVFVYLTSIAINAIILLLVISGVYWLLLVTPDNSLLFFNCKIRSFLCFASYSLFNWLPVFALIDRFLTATKTPPRPAFCSLFGARLTTGIVAAVSVLSSVPQLLFFETKSYHDEEAYCSSSVSYQYIHLHYLWIKWFAGYIPLFITLIMCFVVGCSKKSSEFQSVEQQEDQTGQQLSRFVVVMSVIQVAFGVVSNIYNEVIPLFGHFIFGFEFIGLIISFLVGFAMVPALRREVKDALARSNKGDDAQKPGDSERQRILMPAVAKNP